MAIYRLTVFESSGDKLVDEAIEAITDTDAKELGEKFLAEKQLIDKTHRLVSPDGRLILFHV
ncbi:YhzD family protein [Bacillus kwashiorkori]|uniref:YhzD family protein n=1 Tax=Bacillus kwashiorkori TaxID=1522318 RepID=UPI000780BAD2|nr:YhzD family protein [Bacillus kwashiorkori]